MDNPLFSIITSSFKKARYLIDWGNSIISQKYRPLEVVFVDDASTDDTRQVFKTVLEKITSVGIAVKQVINPYRVYCGSSYEIARRNASGKYIGVLDADDMLRLDAVEYVVGLYLANPDVKYIYTQHFVYTTKMKMIKKGFSSHPGKFGNLLAMGLAGKHGFSHWRTFAADIPNAHKLFKPGLRCAVDKYMGYRLEEGGIGMFTPKVCYNYRRNIPSSVTFTEPGRNVWHEVLKEAIIRRKKYNLNAYEIINHKE